MNNDEWYEPIRFEIEIIEVKSDCHVNHHVDEKFMAEYRTPDRPICGEAYLGMYPLLSFMRINGDMTRIGQKKNLR